MEVNSLPPRVKGDIRFFLSLRVQGLERCSPLNRLKLSWWGDKSEYTLAENIEVKFPVLCAKKQFLQYLADSGVIVLHLMDSNGATKGCAFVNCFPLKDSLNLVSLISKNYLPFIEFRSHRKVKSI